MFNWRGRNEKYGAEAVFPLFSNIYIYIYFPMEGLLLLIYTTGEGSWVPVKMMDDASSITVLRYHEMGYCVGLFQTILPLKRMCNVLMYYTN